MTMKSTVAILLTALAVAACSTTREVAAPVDPLAGVNKIVATSNGFLASRLHLTGGLASSAFGCSAFACRTTLEGFLVGPTGFSRQLFEDGFEQEREIGDVQLVESIGEDGDWRLYGGWLDNAAVFVQRFRLHDPTGESDLFAGFALGPLSEDPLPVEGTASWRGAMVGVDFNSQDRYAGDANLVATFGDAPFLGVSFTRIANVETGAAREDISFDEVSLGLSRSRFVAWQPGDVQFQEAPIYINGGFYGPNHQEAAGVFGYNELIGAFGARKQE